MSRKSFINRHFDCRCSNCLTPEASRILGSNDKALHVCPYDNCRRLFEYPSVLADHMDKHSGEWPHCDKQFLTKDHLKRHFLGIHLGEKNYGCHLCNYKAYKKDQLQSHLEKHRNENTTPIIYVPRGDLGYKSINESIKPEIKFDYIIKCNQQST